ncbi:MAG: Ig-like domain repeat protein [Acidobacteriota bacterium]|nr:Ig-like domain repeat protein [Acidobacteriota bacterium]
MRRLISRAPRLWLVAGLGIALALPALALPAGNTRGLATQTTLTAETHDQGGRTQATLTVTVTGQDGQPATGAVVIRDKGKPLAGVALDANGRATSVLDLREGDHRLSAVYTGDAAHMTSVSQVTPVRALTSTTPDFSVSVSPASLTLTAGQSGTTVASITPVNASSLTAPMFVTLSCSGLPDQSACTFTPENIEILPNATAAITSTMVIATSAGISATAKAMPQQPVAQRGASPIAWAVLLPGALGLAGLAFGARRRRWLSRLSLMGLVALVATLGTTACSPLYYYYNHGPPHNLPTPSGSYTVNVTAQSSNGITAITHSTTVALTVNPLAAN